MAKLPAANNHGFVAGQQGCRRCRTPCFKGFPGGDGTGFLGVWPGPVPCSRRVKLIRTRCHTLIPLIPRILLFLALLCSQLTAAVVGRWVASDLATGAVTTWGDRISSLPAAASGAPSKTANGVTLNGSSALVVPAASNPLIGDNTFTATVACKVTAGATRAGLTPGNTGTWWGNGFLVGRELAGSNRGDWALAVGSQNVALAGRGNPDAGVSGGSALNDGLSHVVTGVFNGAGATIALFVDGVKISTVTGAGTSAIESDTLNFGVNILGNSDTAYFTGSLLEIQLDNAVLADGDVVTLQNSLLASYRAGPVINSFTSNKSSAYEGESVLLSWNVGTTSVTGTYSYEIKRGATTVTSGTATSGSFSTAIPSLAGTAQTVTYSFRAIETGGNNITNTASVSVSGNPGIPVATGQGGLTTPANTAKNITLTGSDPNGGALSYVIVTQPLNGILSGTGANRAYTPTPNVYGADSFTFKVNDGTYDSPPATVSITVQTPPLPPTAVLLDDTTIPPTAVPGNFLGNLSSPDPNLGEGHTYTLVTGLGGEENANFTIVGHQLRAAVAFASLVGQPQRIRVRSTDTSGLSVEGSFALSVVAKVKGIVINEIHYNGQDNTVRNSFVEFYNNGDTAVNLTGWRVSGAVDYAFPANTTVAPGGYLVVAEDPATILSYWGKTALGPWLNSVEFLPDGAKTSNGLPNDGGTLRLRNATDTIVSEVQYAPNFPWPTSPNGDGVSLEKLHPDLDGSHGGNWAPALAPGAAASVSTYVPAASAGWKYFKGATGPAASWKDLNGADLTGWLDGTTVDNGNGTYNGIGYADNDDATVLSDMQNAYQSVYFRHTFTIPNGQMPAALALRVYIDDGCIIWINGIEIPVRFHASAGTPSQSGSTVTGVTFTNHEAAPNTWDTYTIPNAQNYLVEGANVIAILGANDLIGSSDFSFNLELKEAVPAGDVATPGAKNLRHTTNAAPSVRQVAHAPVTPTSSDPIVVTARVTDPQGVASVFLAYQLCAAGNYIPSTLPKSISGNQFVNVATPLAANPAFELAANWTTVAMNDDGLGGDILGGDGVWTATLPAQAHRTLVRYRITAADNAGNSARAPYAGDPSLNFAAFVYNGVPAYQGTPGATLAALPTYHFISRKADWDQCLAFNAADQLLGNTPSWTFENWEAAFVYDGIVYDHVPYRLHGANGRYSASGLAGAAATSKRAFKFLFNKGYEFQGRDNSGKGYPTKWATMITENCWENRGTYTFSLNEAVNFRLLNALGVPCPLGNFAHFRTPMQTAEQPDAWHGDFWGLMYVHEDYDKRFLDAHNLPKGNLYKLTRDGVTGTSQQRYQAVFGATGGVDHDDIANSLRGTSAPAYITGRVNLDLWCRYHAFAEAIRHYDYWPVGDNNSAWYFYPNYNATNGNRGVLWYFPNDVDATWGPTWNNGHDIIHNSLFDDSLTDGGANGGDASTNPTLWPNYFNQVREVRALLWQPDQVNPVIDEMAETIRPFVNADFARWYGAPNDAGNFNGLIGFGMSSSVGQTSLNAYVAGMKDFAFDADNNGSTWPGADVGVGGRAAFLDTLGASVGEDATKYPARPTLSFAGTGGFPVNDLRFTSSVFSDPQGGTAAAIQWRVAEVNTSSTFTAGVPRLLEINAIHDSAALATVTNSYKFPGTDIVPGHRYRARVRMKDSTGRWSTWSTASEFTAGTPSLSVYTNSLVVSEIMYHATAPTPAEQAVAAALSPAQLWTDDDFDYVELRNVGAAAVDLTGVQFTSGFDFTFPAGTTINAGASLLVVQNSVAFTTRYGAGKPVAGAWGQSDKLSNGGETVALSYGQIVPPVFSFTYDDNPALDWPTQPDGLGASLVRIAPENLTLDPSLGVNWRSSLPGGSPGTDDRQTFAQWLTTNSVALADGDADKDGLPNLVEYALGGNPNTASASRLPASQVQPLLVNTATDNYLTLSFLRSNTAENLTQHVEFSNDLTTWTETGVRITFRDNGDGTRTEVWRSAAPVNGTAPAFARLRFTSP